jgi:hypothetical protein
MPDYKYVGDSERDFPDLGLTVAPGDVVTRDQNPAPVFFEEVTPAPAKAAKAAKSS